MAKQTPRNFAPASSTVRHGKANENLGEVEAPITLTLTQSPAESLTAVIRTTTPNEKVKKVKVEELPWRITPITDASKLFNNYLMLSKFRLTCKLRPNPSSPPNHSLKLIHPSSF